MGEAQTRHRHTLTPDTGLPEVPTHPDPATSTRYTQRYTGTHTDTHAHVEGLTTPLGYTLEPSEHRLTQVP